MNDNMNSPSKRTAKRFGFLMIAVTLGSGWLTVVESVGQEPALSALTQTIDSSDIGKRDSRSNVRKEKFRKRESRSASRKKERGRHRSAQSDSLKLNGTFSITWGDFEIVSGEGRVQLNLSQETVKDSASFVGEQLDKLSQISETMRTASEVLSALSDPAVQENLKQVQQLLNVYKSVSGSGTN